MSCVRLFCLMIGYLANRCVYHMWQTPKSLSPFCAVYRLMRLFLRRLYPIHCQAIESGRSLAPHSQERYNQRSDLLEWPISLQPAP